jgi:hypothetical protein
MNRRNLSERYPMDTLERFKRFREDNAKIYSDNAGDSYSIPCMEKCRRVEIGFNFRYRYIS